VERAGDRIEVLVPERECFARPDPGVREDQVERGIAQGAQFSVLGLGQEHGQVLFRERSDVLGPLRLRDAIRALAPFLGRHAGRVLLDDLVADRVPEHHGERGPDQPDGVRRERLAFLRREQHADMPPVKIAHTEAAQRRGDVAGEQGAVAVQGRRLDPGLLFDPKIKPRLEGDVRR
jgi:hypothetical protein